MRASLFALTLAVSLAISGCSGAPSQTEIPKSTAQGLEIAEARLVLPVVAGSPAAAYFTLINSGDQPQKIMSIQVSGAGSAMIHDTVDKNGVGSMQMVNSATIAAHSELAFTPGGRHVMVMSLKPELKPGAQAVVKINLENGDMLAAALPVISSGTAASN